MSRINTNVQSLLAQRVLGQQNNNLTKSLERLSTGLAINRGADNPAGLIASENLRSEKEALTAAISNAERADQVMNIAEGGLQEVSSLLLELQGLVGESANEAGLSSEEKAANQLQIDSIIQTIDRIAQSTSFQGTKLLNGTFDFTVSAVDNNVVDYKVNAAKLNHGENRKVNVVVTDSAHHASLFLSMGGTSLNTTNATSNFIFELAGSKGSREFEFASGTTLTVIASSINTFKTVTGISAVASGNYVELKSIELGSDEFVSVKMVNDGGHVGSVNDIAGTGEDDLGAVNKTFANAEGAEPIRDTGQDVVAIVNGIAATAKGSKISVNTDFLNLEMKLDDTGAQTLASTAAFTITGGGAKFNLGPRVNITNQSSIGIQNIASRNLGVYGTGYLDDLSSGKSNNVVDGNIGDAQTIVDAAISQVSGLRGRMGAFQRNTIGATIRSLGVALENTAAAESSIRDTDFANETAELTRSQILVNAATNVLSMANSQPQSVLSLLG